MNDKTYDLRLIFVDCGVNGRLCPAGNVRELASKFPGQDVTALLGREPTLLLGVQSRDDMISYDNGSLAQVNESIKGTTKSDW